MKKISILFATILAVLGMTSCSQDTEPVYHEPTTFVLNEPVFQNEYYELTDGNSFYLFCTQPDYGYSAVTTYALQVSKTPEFTETVVDGVATPNYITIATGGKGTMANMEIRDADMALAICQLYGVESEEDMAQFDPETGVKVYVRAIASLENIPSSVITSNVVSINKLMPFFAVPQPGFIYLVGQPEGWAGPSEGNAAHYADWRLFENKDEIGSKIYHGTFEIPADQAMFRFYTELTGWDGGDSWGYQVDDNATDFTFTDGLFQNTIAKGKGSYNFPGWTGGYMVITVDMSTSQAMVIIEAHEGEVIPQE